jgi:hypothetical protein
MILSISSMSALMSLPQAVVGAHLGGEAQPGERRAQVVRDAGENQGAVLVETGEVATTSG